MHKDEYILRSLSKIKHKKWELFVVSRIIHNLDDPEIEFVCQQLVRTDDGRFLTDLYFPQFGTHLEVDERHHLSDENIKRDTIRSQQIIKTTDHKVSRISIQGGLNTVIKKTDTFIERIKKLKTIQEENGTFAPWNFEHRYQPSIHINAGKISLDSGATFLKQKNALECFGYGGGEYQRGGWNIPETNYKVWFPKLYLNQGWDNKITSDGKCILETQIGENPIPVKQRIDTEDGRDRIVFARWISPLKQPLYKFTGVFRLDKETSNKNAIVTYRRMSRSINLRQFHTT